MRSPIYHGHYNEERCLREDNRLSEAVHGIGEDSSLKHFKLEACGANLDAILQYFLSTPGPLEISLNAGKVFSEALEVRGGRKEPNI